MTVPRQNDPPQDNRRRIPAAIRAILADGTDGDSHDGNSAVEQAMRNVLERQKQLRFAVLTAPSAFWPQPEQSIDLTADFGPERGEVLLKLMAEGGQVFLTGDVPPGCTPASLIQVLTALEAGGSTKSDRGRHGRNYLVAVPPPPSPADKKAERPAQFRPERVVVLSASSEAPSNDDIYPKPFIDANGTLQVRWFPAASDEYAAEVLVAEVRGLSEAVPFLATREGNHRYLTAAIPGFRDLVKGKPRIDLCIRPLLPRDWLTLKAPLSSFALADRQVESWTFASDSRPGRAQVFMPPDDEAMDTIRDPQTTWLLGYLPETRLPKGDR